MMMSFCRALAFYLRDRDISGPFSDGRDASGSGGQEGEKVKMGLTKKEDSTMDPTTESSGLEDWSCNRTCGASVEDGEGDKVSGGGTGVGIGSIESSGEGGGWWEQDR